MKIKQTALVASLLLLISVCSFGQKKAWKELDEYHSVMAKTFHPAEEGNLKPVMTRSGELVAKAVALQKAGNPGRLPEGRRQTVD